MGVNKNNRRVPETREIELSKQAKVDDSSLFNRLFKKDATVLNPNNNQKLKWFNKIFSETIRIINSLN